ncbi:putative amidohydrolase [Mesorhizobium sangaii]|uniref:Putative amidohydrolase n=1 Tax=Mesorhizobium sangaii TaxID=505389 RepID=A0A841P6R1_9HYPH|nr:putative amidohydrolase [Mesorhizobium sangaii]
MSTAPPSYSPNCGMALDPGLLSSPASLMLQRYGGFISRFYGPFGSFRWIALSIATALAIKTYPAVANGLGTMPIHRDFSSSHAQVCAEGSVDVSGFPDRTYDTATAVESPHDRSTISLHCSAVCNAGAPRWLPS